MPNGDRRRFRGGAIADTFGRFNVEALERFRSMVGETAEQIGQGIIQKADIREREAVSGILGEFAGSQTQTEFERNQTVARLLSRQSPRATKAAEALIRFRGRLPSFTPVTGEEGIFAFETTTGEVKPTGIKPPPKAVKEETLVRVPRTEKVNGQDRNVVYFYTPQGDFVKKEVQGAPVRGGAGQTQEQSVRKLQQEWNKSAVTVRQIETDNPQAADWLKVEQEQADFQGATSDLAIQILIGRLQRDDPNRAERVRVAHEYRKALRGVEATERNLALFGKKIINIGGQTANLEKGETPATLVPFFRQEQEQRREPGIPTGEVGLPPNIKPDDAIIVVSKVEQTIKGQKIAKGQRFWIRAKNFDANTEDFQKIKE